MKHLLIIISLLFSYTLSASVCDHHLDRRKEAQQAAKHAQTAAIAAAVGVTVLCPFCFVHAIVASVAVSAAQQEFEDEAEEQLRKYKNCEAALKQEDRNKVDADYEEIQRKNELAIQEMRKKIRESSMNFGAIRMHGMGPM